MRFLTILIATFAVQTAWSDVQISQPLYQLSNGVDHMLSVDPNEGKEHGYHQDCLLLYTVTRPFPGTIPLYRCIIGTNHFVSLSPDCEGQTTEGKLGYVFKKSFPGSMQILRCYKHDAQNPRLSDHYTTTSLVGCRKPGYNHVDRLGYTFKH